MTLVDSNASVYGSRKLLPHRTAIATVCLSGHLEDKLRAIAAAGFDGVEIFETDLLHYAGSRKDIAKLCRDLGLHIDMFQPFRDLEGAPTESEFLKAMSRLEKKFQWMDELGTDLVLVCSNCSPTASPDRKVQAEHLRRAAELAERYGKRIAYEALSWGTHVYTWEASWELVKEVNHPSLGLCLDSFHIFVRAGESDYAGIASVPAEKIFYIQLADAPILQMDCISYSRHHRNFPLQGAFPITGFMEALVRSGYTGTLSLEVFNDDFRAAPATDIAMDGYRSLMFLQSKIYSDAILPPLPKIHGILFVEFAADEARLPLLESFFWDMGFKKAAKHRTKNVFVYRKGGVSLILNAEPESFAASFLIMHDCSVCALAIKVNDVDAMVKRAAALGCAIVSPSKLGEGEEEVIAIQGPDDTLVYLVDNEEFWEKDFLFESTGTNGLDRTGGLTSYTTVDHISQALDRLSMDRFVLFYESVFGMAPQDVLELNDPYGLTKTRPMVSSAHPLRFTLNVSDEKDTTIGRLVKEAAGSVVHHLAFATDDIFSLVAHLSTIASRDRFLRVPANYYDDLAVKFELPAEFIARLRASNVMYDRDEAGEFLHISTEQFSQRFFFEIVQRGTGYERFGSANAPIRMSIHHEMRNLTAKVGASLSPKRRHQSIRLMTPVAVVYPEGCERLVVTIAEILGTRMSFVNEAVSQLDGVVGVTAWDAVDRLGGLKSEGCITLNLHCTDDQRLDSDSTLSDLCDYEYLFSVTEFSRSDIARFLSFITGQTDPHADILRKPRSNFITLTFPDIRPALPNLAALTVGADAIELRVDMLREGSGGADADQYNPIPSLDYVGKQLMWLRQRTELPVIFSLRSQIEGGRCPSSDDRTTHRILRKGIQWGCEYVDVEVRLPEAARKDLAARKGRSKILASYHELFSSLKWGTADPQRICQQAASYGDVIKIIGFATTLADNYELEYFRSAATIRFKQPLLAMNAGQVGQLSRILNTFFTPTTHPLLPTAAAPGLLSCAEINSALNIMGLIPKKTIFTLTSAAANDYFPQALFWEKCFKELGLPHSYNYLDRMPEGMVSALARQSSFGGALVYPPLRTGSCTFISEFTHTSQESGAVDTIALKSVGTQRSLIGDNSTAKAVLSLLTTDFAASAFGASESKALVVASSSEEAASAMWALRTLGVAEICTVGFHGGGAKLCGSVEEAASLDPFCIISALGREKRAILNQLVRLLRRANGVMVDLVGDPDSTSGISKGWVVYGRREVAAKVTEHAFKGLVGVRVPGMFVRMASGSAGGLS